MTTIPLSLYEILDISLAVTLVYSTFKISMEYDNLPQKQKGLDINGETVFYRYKKQSDKKTR